MQFGSDNQSWASPKIMEMLNAVNSGHTPGYGDDDWTARAVDALKETFQCDLEAFFVPTGTASNGLALATLVQPWESVLCHSQAHLLTSEGTAPEFFSSGARLLGISHGDGKLCPQHLDCHFSVMGSSHNSVPRALSVAQVAENGLVYSPEELSLLCSAAHRHELKIHMDGARFANAVAALNCSPADISWKAGVDVLCLGATKNGALAAEAVIFFQRGLAEQLQIRRKRSGHLLSKGRFLGAQFLAWLKDGHWLELAKHANEKAAILSRALAEVPGVRLAWPTEANEVFVILSKKTASRLVTAGAAFFEWYLDSLPPNTIIGGDEAFIRLVTSFVTCEAQITEFCSMARME